MDVFVLFLLICFGERAKVPFLPTATDNDSKKVPIWRKFRVSR